MKINFESEKYFKETLAEVDALLFIASYHEYDVVTYGSLNKSAILLLTAKFENYIENTIEEYVAYVNKFKLNSKRIPEVSKLKHTVYKLKDFEQYCKEDKKYEACIAFQEIGTLWGSARIFSTLKVDNKFAYGKHGGKDIEKLFDQVGLNNIFDKIKIYKKVEALIGVQKEERDVAGIVNAVIGQRNCIIHEDKTPSLTHQDVYDYKSFFEQFGKGISKLLRESLLKIKK